MKLSEFCFHDLLPRNKPPQNLWVKPATILFSAMIPCCQSSARGPAPWHQLDAYLGWDVHEGLLTCLGLGGEGWSTGAYGPFSSCPLRAFPLDMASLHGPFGWSPQQHS